MKVILYIAVSLISVTLARLHVPTYSKYGGIPAKRIYNNIYGDQKFRYTTTPGFSSPILNSNFILDKGYYKIPSQGQNFVDLRYAVGGSYPSNVQQQQQQQQQQYQPLTNPISNEQLVKFLYNGLVAHPTSQSNLFQIVQNSNNDIVASPTTVAVIPVPATYVPENLRNIYQSRNVNIFQEDLNNAYTNSVPSAATAAVPPKAAYLKENDSNLIRVVRQNFDFGNGGDVNTKYFDNGGILYKVLPEKQQRRTDSSGHYKIDIIAAPKYKSTINGGGNQLQIIGEQFPFNTGEILLQENRPQSEYVRLLAK